MAKTEYKLISDYRNHLMIEFESNNQSIKFDLNDYYEQIKKRIQTGLKKEPLFKLIKPNQTIIDSTSGLLQDSLILASFNKAVIALEMEESIFNLQQTIIEQVLSKDPFFKKLLPKLSLKHGNSVTLLKEQNHEANLLYVDLMFDDTKSAAPKKSKQLLRLLASDSNNYQDFVALAKAQKLKLLIKTNHKNDQLLAQNLEAHKINNLYFYYLA